MFSDVRAKEWRIASLAIMAGFWITGCSSSSVQTALEEAEESACSIPAITAEEALVSIPFEIVHGRVYIKAQVNGRGPYTFAVDTGASGLGRADASLTAELQLPMAGDAETDDGVNVASVEMVKLDTLDVGGLIKSDLEVITRDYSSSAPEGAAISGIVGREFFGDGLLVIDFPARILTFTRSQQLEGGAPGVLAYERAFRVPVSIGELSTEAQLDTGAAVELVLPQSVYDAVSASPLENAGKAQLTNTAIETSRSWVRGPVSVGHVSVYDVEARVSDKYPEVMVGGQILQDYIVAFDQRAHLVAVCSAT